MPSNVYVMEACNLFCGDVDPSLSQHLTLSELKLPGLEENYVDHVAGGAPLAIEIDTHINRLEATFNLAGWQPEVMTMIGASRQGAQTFTAYGVIRDRRSGKALESKAIMGGRLGRVNPANWRRGDLQHHEYSIRGLTHYELYMDGEEIYNWDFFLNQRRIGGIDLNLDINTILRIPSAP
jgi:Bacteriophage tail tube protein